MKTLKNTATPTITNAKQVPSCTTPVERAGYINFETKNKKIK
jgi:hypothetical protein